MGNLLPVSGLSDNELQDIKELDESCSRHEKLNMKLNWDMLISRPDDENNDFLYYEGNKLVGFLGLYGFGPKPKEIEITGMVHPDYRHKGIFKELFNAARQECIARGAGRILSITERHSVAGTNFVKAGGSQYSFSEYRMKFSEAAAPDFLKHGIILKKAEYEDYPELIHLDALCFGAPDCVMEDRRSEEVYKSVYAAELQGEFIGEIGALMEGKDGYIFGFGVKPEYRGRGYGREILSLMLQKLLAEQINTILLEVEVKNGNALSLYKSCGFKELTAYDYYEMVL